MPRWWHGKLENIWTDIGGRGIGGIPRPQSYRNDLPKWAFDVLYNDIVKSSKAHSGGATRFHQAPSKELK